MIFILNIVLSILPVFIFLIVLIFIDSFKLIKQKTLAITLIIGAITALLAMYANIGLLSLLELEQNFILYSRYIAPFIEEFLKVLFPIYLLKSRKFAFMVDGAIYGFAVGAGFAFVENLFYLNTLQDPNMLLWVIRGFGTAVMHGGSTAIFAILLKSILDRKTSEKWYYFIPPLLSAIVIHSVFNHFFWGPLVTVAAQLVLLPVLIIVAFKYSEKALKEWLDLGLDVDVWLLDNIISGTIHNTKIGDYLDSLKEKFPGEIIADMLCYLRLHVELSIHAKGVLLMREAGFDVSIDRETRERFTELKHLQKTIGKTGQLALSPIMLNTARDLWQFYFIDEKK